MADQSLAVRSATGGGVTATHLSLPEPEALVAPATAEHEKEHNTIKSSLVPFACWRADDLRFNFESSFVLPEIKAEMKALKELLDEHSIKDDTVGSSRVDLQACKLEYSIVSPK